ELDMRRQRLGHGKPDRMRGRASLWVLFLVISFCPTLGAADPRRASDRSPSETPEPSPIEDDANLHDVQFVGSRQGWAVGDHGVTWHSEGGGEWWSLQASGARCALHAVCFLSDRVGWVAGGGTAPYTRHSYGVVLATSDGGRTWTPLVAPPSSTKPSDRP